MADVSFELLQIVNGRYGSDIRMAIHDALEKINNASSSSGGGGGRGPVGNTVLQLGGYDNLEGSGYANYRTFAPCEYAENSSSSRRTSATLSKSVLGSHVVLACIMHTGDITVSEPVWTSVCSSEGITKDGETLKISVYKRSSSYETVSVTATAEASEIICLKLIVLNQNENVSSNIRTVMDDKYYQVPTSQNDTIYLASSFNDGNPSFFVGQDSGVETANSGQFAAFFVPSGLNNATIYYYTQDLPDEKMELLALNLV